MLRYNVSSDSVNLREPTDAILVGAAGVVAAVLEGGDVVNLTLPAGAWVPLRVQRVNAASTTVTGLVALYAR